MANSSVTRHLAAITCVHDFEITKTMGTILMLRCTKCPATTVGTCARAD